MFGHGRQAFLKQTERARSAAMLLGVALTAGSAVGCKANASAAANADSGTSEAADGSDGTTATDGSRVISKRSRKAAAGSETSAVARATKEDNAKRCASLAPERTPNGQNYASHIIAGGGRNRPAEIVAYLASKGRCAFVLPAGNTAVVFDAYALRDRELLGANLSKRFKNYVLAVSGHGDEQFGYVLFADGKLVDEYDSFPKTDGDVDGSPTGGDVEVLLEVTKSAAEPDGVETTLRRGHDTYGGYVYESARHRDLMRALNLPEWSALYGFGDFKSGKRPKEIAPKTVLKTF